jgi:hypothetical protein
MEFEFSPLERAILGAYVHSRIKNIGKISSGFSTGSLENPWKTLRKPRENLSIIFLILRWAYASKVALSNGENPNSIAASGAELFSKQPSAFYFEMDSNRHDIHYSSNTVVSLLVPLLMSPAKPLQMEYIQMQTSYILSVVSS